ncbi:MAG: hypothetical protein ACE5E3_05635 [Mariprofundus sp.]
MLKIGLSMAVILMVSGCASVIGDEPELVQDTTYEESRNEQLRMEAAALREAIKDQKNELDRLKAGSQ